MNEQKTSYNKNYYEANKEKIKEKRKAYYEANRDKINEKRRTKYSSNKLVATLL